MTLEYMKTIKEFVQEFNQPFDVHIHFLSFWTILGTQDYTKCVYSNINREPYQTSTI